MTDKTLLYNYHSKVRYKFWDYVLLCSTNWPGTSGSVPSKSKCWGYRHMLTPKVSCFNVLGQTHTLPIFIAAYQFLMLTDT